MYSMGIMGHDSQGYRSSEWFDWMCSEVSESTVSRHGHAEFSGCWLMYYNK